MLFEYILSIYCIYFFSNTNIFFVRMFWKRFLGKKWKSNIVLILSWLIFIILVSSIRILYSKYIDNRYRKTLQLDYTIQQNNVIFLRLYNQNFKLRQIIPFRENYKQLFKTFFFCFDFFSQCGFQQNPLSRIVRVKRSHSH